MQYIVPLKIACALLVLMLVSAAVQNRIGAGADAQSESNNGVPIVEFPFKNLFDDQGKPLNVILIAAPFRNNDDEEAYEKYRRQGLSFCGISSYINFPGHIENPHEDRFHEERGHDYPAMVSAWLHCFRDPPTNLQKSGLPLMLLAESDLKDTDAYKPDPSIKKEYDFNQFQLEELSSLALVSGEQEELESSQEILENAEDIKLKINEVLSLFHEEQFGVLQGMGQIQSSLQGLERLAQAFATYRTRFQEAWIELKDLAETLADEDSRVEVDAEKLERTRERLSKIYQLQKKHGLQTIEELMELESQLADKVLQVQQVDDQLAEAHQLCLQNEKAMLAAAEVLSQKRRACFPSFEKALEVLLQDLGMENARVQFERQVVDPNANGLDRVELLFSANKGMPLHPLKKVASGGEFSRLLFAIKYLMADKMALPTLIFDEIDSGISGEVALQMVRMMQVIAQNHQVICITHLPQVAAKGEVHFFVYKDHSAEKTISKVKELTAEERVHELAKMIAGVNPSPAAQASAKELLMN
jgi:DNA repair protein RecN